MADLCYRWTVALTSVGRIGRLYRVLFKFLVVSVW